jgi:hypothetical protein
MADDKTPTVINPKEEGEKHTPNTSELSMPHTSVDHPEEHVDSMAFGEDGNRAPEHDVDGITDEGSKSLGQETYDKHQEDKK